MRAALRKAVSLIATQGLQVGKAAEAVGMHPVSLSKAINRPEVREYLEEQKALYCLDADKLKGLAKAMAIQTGIGLMRDSLSDTVKARMVEFFAGEVRSGPLVNVNIGGNTGGYEFLRPGQRIIDITPLDGAASDSPSGDIDGQAIDNDGE